MNTLLKRLEFNALKEVVGMGCNGYFCFVRKSEGEFAPSLMPAEIFLNSQEHLVSLMSIYE